MLVLPDIVAVQYFLVAQVESTIDNHRVCPNPTGWLAEFGLWIECKFTSRLPAIRRSIDQNDSPIIFSNTVEAAIGIG